MTEFGQQEALRGIVPFYQVVLNLSGASDNPVELEGEAMDMFVGKTRVAEKDSLSGRMEISARLVLAYYFENWELCEELLPLVAGKYAPAKAHYSAFQLAFSSGMANWELYRQQRKPKFKRKAEALVKRMSGWVDQGSVNCRPSLLLMEAEGKAVTGAPKTAVIKAFDAAARSTKEMRLLQQEGIAYEMGAKYLKGQDDELWRRSAGKALKIYYTWGAMAKVQAVEESLGLTIEELIASTSSQQLS